MVLCLGLVGTYFAYLPQLLSSKESAGSAGSQDADYEYENLKNKIREYEEKLKEKPKDVEILWNLGNAYYDLGVRKLIEDKEINEGTENLKKSLEVYEKAAEISPNDAKIWGQAAGAAYYVGDMEKAEKYYKKTLSLEPQSVDMRINYGQFLLYGKNDIAGAKAQWKEALSFAKNKSTREALEAMLEQVEEMEKQQSQNGENS
ncbi:MAG: Uncharacterized protein XD50_0160 [Clostridia bacterium 41_269]|nr:MAG: Uncharacterized protein XD50_0160 [Clostridia bacterium 41_269]